MVNMLIPFGIMLLMNVLICRAMSKRLPFIAKAPSAPGRYASPPGGPTRYSHSVHGY